MRFDRTISLLISMLTKKYYERHYIPILMYHSVSLTVKISNHPYFCTAITPRRFEEHLKLLQKLGYSIKKLDELTSVIPEFEQDKKVAVITFDDGYHDFYEYALPLLRKYNIPASVFIPAGLVNMQEPIFDGKRLMDWEQIKECYMNGNEIGSHSMSHRKLVTINKSELKFEILKSKEKIESILFNPISSFSYPYKFPEENHDFTKLYCELLMQAGYTNGVTTRIGCAKKDDDFLLLKRIPVNEYDDEKLFKAKLQGGYDWLYTLQFYFKRIRCKVR